MKRRLLSAGERFSQQSAFGRLHVHRNIGTSPNKIIGLKEAEMVSCNSCIT